MPAAKRSRKSTCKGAITLTRQGNKDIVRFKTTANVTPHVFSPNPFDKLPIEVGAASEILQLFERSC